MDNVTFTGIFFVGFVFGYLLYYAVRHTKDFSVDLLSSAIGAVGGGAVIGMLGRTELWIGPYGIGLAAGFFFYLILAFILIASGRFANLVGPGPILLLQRTLLGSPKQE